MLTPAVAKAKAPAAAKARRLTRDRRGWEDHFIVSPSRMGSRKGASSPCAGEAWWKIVIDHPSVKKGRVIEHLSWALGVYVMTVSGDRPTRRYRYRYRSSGARDRAVL